MQEMHTANLVLLENRIRTQQIVTVFSKKIEKKTEDRRTQLSYTFQKTNFIGVNMLFSCVNRSEHDMFYY